MRCALSYSRVFIEEKAEKGLRKLPRHILVIFEEWVRLIEEQGYAEMKKVPGYRDHNLKGKLIGKRSSSLNKSYRVIYHLEDEEIIIVKVIEVNKHDYKI